MALKKNHPDPELLTAYEELADCVNQRLQVIVTRAGLLSEHTSWAKEIERNAQRVSTLLQDFYRDEMFPRLR